MRQISVTCPAVLQLGVNCCALRSYFLDLRAVVDQSSALAAPGEHESTSAGRPAGTLRRL